MSVWLEVGQGYHVFGENPESYVDSKFLATIQKVCGFPDIKVVSLPEEIPGCISVGIIFGEKTNDVQRAIDTWSSCGSLVCYSHMKPNAQHVHYCEKIKEFLNKCDWVYVLVDDEYALRDYDGERKDVM